MNKLRINPKAAKDLHEIKDYIEVESGNLDTALKTVNSIVDSFNKLTEFPRMGKDLSEVIEIKTGFRYIVSGHYLVFYRLDQEYISIYRILDSRRDYLKILFHQEE